MKKILLTVAAGLALSSNCSALNVDSAVSKTETLVDAKDVSEQTVFGSSLFKGEFAKNKNIKHNPEYIVNIGDQVSVKLWGGNEFSGDLVVDSQGYIFIPKVGTVLVAGNKSSDLNSIINASVKRIYKNSVFVYADLNQYQPVSVFVTGYVKKPGLYDGSASDSLLQFLDKSGGINSGGSYRNVTVLRDGKTIASADLYEFLKTGSIYSNIFRSGDSILVSESGPYIMVDGDCDNKIRYEVKESQVTTLADAAMACSAKQSVTSALISTLDSNKTSSYKKVLLSDKIVLNGGDNVTFMSEHSSQQVTISFTGEHKGDQSVVLSKGATLLEAVRQISPTMTSDVSNVRLYRKSVAKTQKELILASLKELEATALTTGSSTVEEAGIRKQESQLLLNFIDRAKTVEPLGQVVLHEGVDLASVTLQDGDRIDIPAKDQTIIVQGEVLAPSAQVFASKMDVSDYINASGGLNFRADKDKILIVHSNGVVSPYKAGVFNSNSVNVKSGDSILVLGKVDEKRFQMAKDITQVLYQIAVGAAVAIAAF